MSDVAENVRITAESVWFMMQNVESIEFGTDVFGRREAEIWVKIDGQARGFRGHHDDRDGAAVADAIRRAYESIPDGENPFGGRDGEND